MFCGSPSPEIFFVFQLHYLTRLYLSHATTQKIIFLSFEKYLVGKLYLCVHPLYMNKIYSTHFTISTTYIILLSLSAFNLKYFS